MTDEYLAVLRGRFEAVSGALEAAHRREETLRTEYGERLRTISEEVTRLEAQLKHLSALLALEGEGIAAGAADPAGPPIPPEGFIDLREEAYGLLLEKREAMHYTTMANELAIRGVPIRGADPASNLVAHIHSDPRFKRPKRGFYGLAEWYPKNAPNAGARRRTTKRPANR
jgi:hypothetical protein